MPIVVFTGKELSPAEEARLQAVAKSVVLKDVRSPERLFDETALFLHRVVAELPGDKRQLLRQLHGSNEVLRGRQVLVVDDDARNIFALSTLLETHGMEVVERHERPRRDRHLAAPRRPERGADGHHDAGHGRLRDDARDPATTPGSGRCRSWR